MINITDLIESYGKRFLPLTPYFQNITVEELENNFCYNDLVESSKKEHLLLMIIFAKKFFKNLEIKKRFTPKEPIKEVEYICHNCGEKLFSYDTYRKHMNSPIPCFD